MDPFDKPYWSRLQVELWVCTRSRGAVRYADRVLGSVNLADLSLGPDGIDDERYDDNPPMFDDETELFGMAIVNYGCVCSHDDARKEVIVALSEGELRAYPASQVGDSDTRFFERAVVLGLWPEEPVAGPPETTSQAPQDEAPAGANAPSGNQIVPKRKGGRPAPWIRALRKHLKVRVGLGHDIQAMSLAQLRSGFSRYARLQGISPVPKARSSLEAQIRKARQEVVAEHEERERREGAASPSIAELTRAPKIGRE